MYNFLLVINFINICYSLIKSLKPLRFKTSVVIRPFQLTMMCFVADDV